MNIDEIRTILQKEQNGNIHYAVLLPLVKYNGKLNILFEIRRSDIPNGGEICFPGGRIEKNETALQAAIRETCEELLIDADQIEVLGELKGEQHSLSAGISSWIAYLHDYHLTYSRDESENIFLIPLDELLSMKPIISESQYKREFRDDFPFDLIPGGKDYPFRSRKTMMYFYQTEYGVIWGLTASILHRFLELCKTY